MTHSPDELPASTQVAKLKAILESALTAIIAIDNRGIIASINPATERLFGYTTQEIVGHNVSILMPQPYHSAHDGYINNYIGTGTKKIIGIGREVLGRRKDGTTFPIHLSVSEFEAEGRRYFTGIIHDLSDRAHVEDALRESERRLAQSQKMDAIGQLTGGIAHDFNNLLQVIIGNLELLEPKLSDTSTRDLLSEAQDAANLGAKLTYQLLAFARRQHLDPQVMKLNDVVIGVADMLRRTLGEHVQLSTSLASDLWHTQADSSQMQSAIVNLALNARDAMDKGGRLIIETRNISLDPDHFHADPELKPGDYVQLAITDTGVGMAPEVRDRAFEPFFTTKEKGRGTGLGLAMVYGFVKQSGGLMTIYSEVGLGTTINVYLPRTQIKSPDEKQAPEASRAPASNETVLVVEDDAKVRALTIKRLRMLGYQVLEAADGPSALAILKSGVQADLLFTDLIMPGGISGRELAKLANELHPHLKIVLTSGYSEDFVFDRDPDEKAPITLRKPYQLSELGRVMQDVLKKH